MRMGERAGFCIVRETSFDRTDSEQDSENSPVNETAEAAAAAAEVRKEVQ